MYLRGMSVPHRCLTLLVLALLLFPAGLAHAHSLDSFLLYVGIPTVLIVVILAPFIKWCCLRWLVTESVSSPLILISIIELCACISALYAVGYWDVVGRIYCFYGYETWQLHGIVRIGEWVLAWLLANILINCLLVRSTNGSTGHILARRKRVLISVVFGVISPGLFWLFTIVSE
ncbi:MAG: hypothetical protein ACLP5H_10430 [Desulfomonilaceae bacterium]